jgi:penicillin-binding protein 1B
MIREITDQQGETVEHRTVQIAQAISPEDAYLLTHLLEGVMERGTGRGARHMGFERPAAGKTGTTNDYGDAWFVGSTPDLLAVVWVGFDHREPLGLSGGQAALPIWTSFMKQATAGHPSIEFIPPPGVTLVPIDRLTGFRATPRCPTVIEEAFLSGEEPIHSCPYHPPSTLPAQMSPAPFSPSMPVMPSTTVEKPYPPAAESPPPPVSAPRPPAEEKPWWRLF